MAIHDGLWVRFPPERKRQFTLPPDAVWVDENLDRLASLCCRKPVGDVDYDHLEYRVVFRKLPDGYVIQPRREFAIEQKLSAYEEKGMRQHCPTLEEAMALAVQWLMMRVI